MPMTALSQEGGGMSKGTEQSGVAWGGDANQSSGECQGRKVGKSRWQQGKAAPCGLGSVRPSRLGTDHFGETETLPLLSLRGPRNITLYLRICTV